MNPSTITIVKSVFMHFPPIVLTLRCRHSCQSLPAEMLHGVAQRQGKCVAPEVTWKCRSGIRFLVVIVIIPTAFEGQIFFYLVNNRSGGQMIVESQWPGRRIGIEDKGISVAAGHGVTHGGGQPLVGFEID